MKQILRFLNRIQRDGSSFKIFQGDFGPNFAFQSTTLLYDFTLNENGQTISAKSNKFTADELANFLETIDKEDQATEKDSDQFSM